MKSINVKRIAAVAAGVAMVGSVMASGLAVVSHEGNVSSLVSNIKANIDKTQVVVGTDGADMSDGIQAAKIAAVLASVNYAAVSSGSVSVTDKSVVLETSAGTTDAITSTTYPVELTAIAAIAGSSGGTGTTGHYATTSGQTVTLTKDTLSAILAQKSLSATVNGSSSTYLYEDRIILNGVNAIYDESSSSAYTGYGMYLNASYASGALEYRIYFSTGLPVGAGRSYSQIPEIDMLGSTTGIDYATASNQSMYIYSGTKKTMMVNDEETTADGYKVHLDSVTQGSGTTYYAIFTATAPGTDGLTETSSQLTSATGGTVDYNFFANKVSVHIDYVGYDQAAAKGTTIARITGGKQLLSDGSAFPMDSGWTVKHVDVSGTSAAGSQTLNYIALKQGGVSSPPTYSGTVQSGLAQGVVINGPKTKDGTPKYQMKLKGFGSTTTVIDSTPVSINSVGSSGAGMPTHIIQPTWVARDGSAQTLDASLPTYVVIPAYNAVGNTSFNTNVNARWMIVNDKVLYLKSVESTGASPPQYNVKFALGGTTGQEITVGPFANASGATSTLTYTSNVNPISCTVTVGNLLATTTDLTNVTLSGTNATNMSATDLTTGVCDIFPDAVPIGASTSISTGVPLLDLRFIQGGAGQANNVTFNESTTNKNWPVMRLIGAGTALVSENVTVIYDSEAGTDGLTGLRAYLNLGENDTANTTNIGRYVVGPQAQLINQAASTTLYENSLYDVTPFSVELSAPTKGQLSAIVPEARRNAIFEISKAVSNGSSTGGTVTATEGQTVGNVKVTSISATASVSGSNIFSPTNPVTPEDLVAIDSAATADYLIVVGGPWVNSVAAGMTGSSLVTSAEGAQYLVAEGNKLLVAGYTAADTIAAANELISLLKA